MAVPCPYAERYCEQINDIYIETLGDANVNELDY